MKTPKTKPINLGELQDDFIRAKKQFESDQKILARAIEAHGRSKREHQDAKERLEAASRTVLE